MYTAAASATSQSVIVSQINNTDYSYSCRNHARYAILYGLLFTRYAAETAAVAGYRLYQVGLHPLSVSYMHAAESLFKVFKEFIILSLITEIGFNGCQP